MSNTHQIAQANPSRRYFLAGVACLPTGALALSTDSAAQTTADPIFAAIERHKEAYRRYCICGDAQGDLISAEWHPQHDPIAYAAAERAANAANEECEAAAFALTEIEPSTMAGVLALVDYVEAFNGGAYVLEGWGASSIVVWPEDDNDDGVDQFGHKLFANLGRAIRATAVQS